MLYSIVCKNVFQMNLNYMFKQLKRFQVPLRQRKVDLVAYPPVISYCSQETIVGKVWLNVP